MEEIVKKFGNRLREIRNDQGLSQEILSRKINKDRTYIGKVERAEISPSLKVVGKIADELNIEPSELFQFSSE